jgi:uncharacterized membrane protein YoaK (UPF0700 family)
VKGPVFQAAGLTLVAGIADAVGYITMGGVFAANMTGNTVLAGIAAAQHDYGRTWRHAAPLLFFFAGAMLSHLLLRLSQRPTASLLLEAVLLAGIGFLPVAVETRVTIVALAMGVQASAITRFAGRAVSTVVVTTTLARGADALLDWLWPAEPATAPPGVAGRRLLRLTWTAYLVGAVAGTMLVPILAWPLVVPAALLVILAI